MGLCVKLRTLLGVPLRKITLVHCIEWVGKGHGWKSRNHLSNFRCIPGEYRWWPQQGDGGRDQR